MLNDRVPLYLQIQTYFKKMISSKKLVENDRIPSEKEIMEQFNVSRIVVANALSALAKEGWIYRIPGRGSFVKERVHESNVEETALTETAGGSAQNTLKMNVSRKRKIGLVMTSIGDYFAIRLLRGIIQAINESDYELMIMLTLSSQEKEQYAIRELTRTGVEGLLIFPSDGEVYNEEILALKNNGFPFVLIDRFLPGIETNVICSDGSLGVQMALSHLWELGHRDIAFCAGNLNPTVEDRISGYMKGLREHGGMINPANILTDRALYNFAAPEDNSYYKFMENSQVSAYIALNGPLGLMLVDIANNLGKRIPEDISIVTFDDPTPEYNYLKTLTYIDQSEEQMGRDAANMIINLLDSDDVNQIAGFNKMIVKPKLVERSSTGPVRANSVPLIGETVN